MLSSCYIFSLFTILPPKLTMNAGICCLLFISAVVTFVASTTERQIFILAGQSNMAGEGGTTTVNGTLEWDGVIPPECQSSPEILRLNDELVWELAKEPLHGGISLSKCAKYDYPPVGIGPGMPFSNSLLKRNPLFGEIGLVPCAVPGTSIIAWSRGSCYYNRLLKRVRAAMLGGGVVRGMLWYQGESDSSTRDDADQYGTRLEALFNDLRSDLLLPQLPIIQVALATGRNFTEIVREAQLKTSLANVKCVDAKGLPKKQNDELHLTTDSQIRLGSMLAETYLRFF